MVYLLKIYGIGLRVLDSGKHGNLKQWSVASEFLSHGIYYGNSIAVIVHSLDPSLSTRLRGSLSGLAIAAIVHSLDPSLSTRLRGSLSGLAIAVIIHSLDPSLSTRLIPKRFCAKERAF